MSRGRGRAASDCGRLNRTVGWTCIAAGIGLGLVLGLWSFDGPLSVPSLLGEYGSTPRRLVRLGHIALIALGIIDILVAGELDRRAFAGTEEGGDGGWRSARAISVAMAAGNVALPAALFVAALWGPAKYLLPVPALAIFGAVVGVASGSLRAAAPSAGKHQYSPASHRLGDGEEQGR